MAPAFLLYAAFNLFPLVQGINISFYDWDGITPGTWVGLGNYTEFFTDPAIRERVRPRPDPDGLLLVHADRHRPVSRRALSRIRIRGLTFFRVLLFLPLVITDVVTASPGLDLRLQRAAQHAAARLGLGHLIPAAGWLGDFNTALPAVGVFGMWGQFGFCLILFVAGVMKIPASLYEAARVDGANAIREFFAVTLPGLRYELQVVLVLTVIGTLGTFDEIYVITNGGPGTATTVPAYLVWRRMFQTGQVGSAAALGIMLMLIVFAVTYGINRRMERGAEA